MNQDESIDAALLDRYLAGESTAAEADIVSRWASERPERQQFLAALAHPSGAFHDGQTLPTWDAEAARRRWQAQVRLETHSPTHSPRLSRAWPQGVWDAVSARKGPAGQRPAPTWIAMAVVIVLGAGLAFGALRHRAFVASPGRTYATTEGQRMSVTLVDGTRLTLAPASRVRVASDYGRPAGSREVDLEGEAYFAVIHDAAHPFAVRAHGAVARDVGTAFDVRAYPEDFGARIAVVEGAVAITMTDGCRLGLGTGQGISPALPHLLATPTSAPARSSANAEPTSVIAASAVAGRRSRPAPRGREATSAWAISRGGGGEPCRTQAQARDVAMVGEDGVVVEHGVDVASLTAWTTGRLVFDDVQVSEVLAELSRWYDLDIATQDAALTTKRVTLAFAAAPVGDVLDGVAAAIGARVERQGRSVLLHEVAKAP